jgi:hypothetical protein
MSKIIYFAYGSNMNLSQMKERCPYSEKIGIGFMKDAEVCFPSFYAPWDSGMAGYQPSPGNDKWGVLFSLDERDLEVMRDYEDFIPGQDPSLNNYNEVFVDIIVGEKTVRCMTYESNITGVYQPSLKYLQGIIAGAVENNLPEEYIEKLSQLL